MFFKGFNSTYELDINEYKYKVTLEVSLNNLNNLKTKILLKFLNINPKTKKLKITDKTIFEKIKPYIDQNINHIENEANFKIKENNQKFKVKLINPEFEEMEVIKETNTIKILIQIKGNVAYEAL